MTEPHDWPLEQPAEGTLRPWYLTATGYLMVLGGIGTALGEPVALRSLPVLFEPGNPVRWLPWTLAAAAIVVLGRRLRRPTVLPIGLALALGAFYLVLALLGLGLEDAIEVADEDVDGGGRRGVGGGHTASVSRGSEMGEWAGTPRP